MTQSLPTRVFALGFSAFKRDLVGNFFPGTHISSIRRLSEIGAGATLLVWGHEDNVLRGSSIRCAPSIIRLEDGFIRSIGLGADYQVKPISWVADKVGIYFDASRPSELENILQTTVFDSALTLRANRLKEWIVTNNLTKYNVGKLGYGLPSMSQTKEMQSRSTALVVGQVENDASIYYGAPGTNTNLELLKTVRLENPDSYLIYKPHPDVVAGLRNPGKDEDQVRLWCDEVVTDCDISAVVSCVDEVHVMTSLAGFEALLRGKKVICHGIPFYAGWGLTTDKAKSNRRNRNLTLDELVAGALILYPVYISPCTNQPVEVEQALQEIFIQKTNTSLSKSSTLFKIKQSIHKLIKQK